MRDITHKNSSLRTAKGYGVVLCSQAIIDLYKKGELPKGAPEGFVQSSAMIGAKNTPNMIPHCHPISLDGFNVSMEVIDQKQHADILPEEVLNKTGFVITAEAKSIGRTGVEMELLTGISSAALTLYDVLKPVDDELEIGSIKLQEKTGGKSDLRKFSPRNVAIIVCSDAVADGKNEDYVGQWVKKEIESWNSEVVSYQICSSDQYSIQRSVEEQTRDDVPIILTIGGTGMGPGDQTPEAVQSIIEQPINSIPDAIWQYGQVRTPRSLFSRITAGFSGRSLIITIPGSYDGAQSAVQSLFPAVFHMPKMLKKERG